MANINSKNPDLLYLKSRDDLLQYEDAKLNSLLQAVANFYTTRNDQSIWGNFLRAIAIELGKVDYGYNYDVVSKNPSFLTPSDIRRRWADPLYVSSNWPTKTQFDTAFKLMLVELIAAYRQGTTLKAIEEVIFAYTGIHIQVIELYKQIGNGIFDESDRNAISVSVTVGSAGFNPLNSVTSLLQLQTIVQSLYNAIDLAKPAHVGLEFSTVFGEAEGLDCLISPEFATQQQFAVMPPSEQSFFSFTGYVLVFPVGFWKASTVSSNPYDLNTLVRDVNGNIQLAIVAGKPGLTQPVWNTVLGGLTIDNQITWKLIAFAVPASQITITQYNALSAQLKLIYQKSYTNTNCSALTDLQPWFHPGINDTLRIFVKQIEVAPFGPMLIQAPVLDPKNPKTTIAAYGRGLSQQLTPVAWSALPKVFVNILNAFSNGVSATYSYIPQTQFLHEGEVLTITGFSNPALNVTTQIRDVVNLAAIINATQVNANVVTIFAPNAFAPGMLVTFSGLTTATYLNGQSLVIQEASPVSFTVNFVHVNTGHTPDTGAGEVSTFQIPNTAVIALQVPSPSLNAGLLSPTLQAGYYLKNGVYVLGNPPIATTGAGIGSSWVPSSQVFQGQIVVDSNGDQQLALNSGLTNSFAPPWNNVRNGTTPDGNVAWRNVGRNTFSAPQTWAGILNFNVFVQPGQLQPFSGEVGNWDSLHQYGLVAPRLNQVWEISGQPQDQDFIFGLY